MTFYGYYYGNVAVFHANSLTDGRTDGRTNITGSLVCIRFAKVPNNAGLFAISVFSRQRGKILFHLGIKFYLSNRDHSFIF